MTSRLTLADALHRAHAMADRVAEAIEGKPVVKCRRRLLAGSALQLTVEHHRSMILLVENQIVGSALSLQRPLFEAFGLGYWLIYRASDDEIDSFAEGRRRPKLEYLRRMLVDDNPGGPPHADMQRFVSMTHDLTHGGLGHLMHRMNAVRLGPSYSDDQIATAFDVATWTTGMAALDMIGAVVEDKVLATVLTSDVQAILNFGGGGN